MGWSTTTKVLKLIQKLKSVRGGDRVVRRRTLVSHPCSARRLRGCLCQTRHGEALLAARSNLLHGLVSSAVAQVKPEKKGRGRGGGGGGGDGVCGWSHVYGRYCKVAVKWDNDFVPFAVNTDSVQRPAGSHPFGSFEHYLVATGQSAPAPYASLCVGRHSELQTAQCCQHA